MSKICKQICVKNKKVKISIWLFSPENTMANNCLASDGVLSCKWKQSYDVSEIENSQIVDSFSQKVKPPSPKHEQSVTPKMNNWCKIFTMICKSKLVHNKTVPLCSPQKEDWLVIVWRLYILKFYKNWHTDIHPPWRVKVTKTYKSTQNLQ